jgi:uncharacterized membrane protein YtjA (UPF0391 family)
VDSRDHDRGFSTHYTIPLQLLGITFQVVPACLTKLLYMLRWTMIFLVVAIVAAIFGFGGIAAGAASIAKFIFFLFLVLFVISLFSGAVRRP